MSTRIRLAAALLSLGAFPIAAQPTAMSAATAGLAGAGAADLRLRGTFAINPALLALPGAPRLSVDLPSADASVAMAPIGLSAIGKYDGTLIPSDVRTDWLTEIRDAGGQTADLSTAVRGAGLQVGALAFSIGTSAGMRAELPPEAAQLALFGNAGRTGALEDVAVNGGRARAWMVSSASLGYGLRMPGTPFGGVLALGLEASVLSGHRLMDVGQVDAHVDGAAGSITGSATELTWGSSTPANALGFGADVGLAWSGSRVTWGLTVSNAINTLQFHTADAWAREGELSANMDSTASVSREGPLAGSTMFSSETQSRATAVTDAARFRPAVHVAARIAASPRWDLLADVDLQPDPDAALVAGPRRSLAVGSDYRVVHALALRTGVAAQQDDAGTRAALAGGLGLSLGVFRLDAGATRQLGAGTLRVAVGTSLVFGGER